MSSITGTVKSAAGSCSWTVVIALLAQNAAVAQTIVDIRIVTPRDFGYTIGDRIRHEMHLSLTASNRLDTTTLPQSGRLNRWLEISRAEAQLHITDGRADYHIVVEYQIFNAPRELTSVTIPQLDFRTWGDENAVTVFMPEWTFTIGPITSSDAHESMGLREDRQPQQIPLEGRRIRLVVSTFVLATLLIYIFYRRFLLPRLARDRYPFSRALSQLRDLRRSGPDAESYRIGLQAFHAAMNATAGQVVFAGNLEDFLSANSKFAALRVELAALYARSQDIFFHDAPVTGSDTSLEELFDLCKRCRSLERSAA